MDGQTKERDPGHGASTSIQRRGNVMAKGRCLKWSKGRTKCLKRSKSGGKKGGSRKRCKYGKLKNPVGRRVCKKRPRKGRRR
jgi:hypothetical protein